MLRLMPVQRILSDPKRSIEHNAFLKQTGLTLPKGSSQDFGYTEKVGPYAVFHHLWRYAAHLEIRGEPPTEPGTHPKDDSCYQQAMAKPETRFDQLLRHSDDTGYYYPIDFRNVFTITPETQNQGGFMKKIIRRGHIKKQCNLSRLVQQFNCWMNFWKLTNICRFRFVMKCHLKHMKMEFMATNGVMKNGLGVCSISCPVKPLNTAKS